MKNRGPRTAWLFCFVSICLALVAGSTVGEEAEGVHSDWPQWRGPQRDGTSDEAGLTTAWPEAGPPVAWRIPVGVGYSGVAVAGGRLYTLWDEDGSQFLFSLDAATGEERWRHRLGPGFQHPYGNGPRSTPAVDGGTVYAAGTGGDLDAVDAASGRRLWRHRLAEEYGSRLPSIGYSSSPLVDGERLLVEVGGTENRAFAAFDKQTGELLWASQDDLPAYSSPIAVTLHGIRQVVFLSASGLFSLSPADGTLLWKHDWTTRCPATGIPLNAAQPVFVAPDKIFVSSSYGDREGLGAAVVRIDREGGTMRTETVWKTEQMRNLVNSSVFYRGHLYGFDRGILKAVDASTGEEKWKARGFERGSLIVADEHLVVLGERCRLALVAADPEGFREVASAEVLTGKCWTSPTLAGGTLYLRNDRELVAVTVG
jgi:outer membrane protein assembly factor BamB